MALVNVSVLHYTDMKKLLKKIFSETACQNWEQFHKIVPCVNLFKNCSQNFDPSKNIAAVGGGGGSFLHCVDFREILQNSSPLQPPVRF